MNVQQAIQNFNTKLRDWISSQVQFQGSTPISLSAVVWEGTPGYTDVSTIGWTKTIYYNTTAGAIAANSLANGGSPNSIFTDDPDINAIINPDDFQDEIDEVQAVPFISAALKNLLALYAKTHKVTFQNRGNIATAPITGVGISSNVPEMLPTEIGVDVDLTMNTTEAVKGAVLDDIFVDKLFDLCKNIWIQRCSAVNALETFRFNFCHNSCHSNNTCYNSRGRR